MNNYFIKLLMLSVNENDFILLYGFCTATTQDTYEWERPKKPKTKHIVWTAILTETEMSDFVKALTQPEMITLSENISFTSPELIERPMVLSNDRQEKTPGPISEYRHLTEFWNIKKSELFQKVRNALGTEGKEFYFGIKELFKWANEECGIDFLKNGYRFGNFEFYQYSKYTDAFEIITHKECCLTKTTITKKKEFDNNLIVNCISECRGRSTINQSKIFIREERSLDFLSKEPMSRVTINIWDEKSGELVFSKDLFFIMKIPIVMNWSSAQYRIQDSWSNNLISAASNRSADIKKHIETVSRTMQGCTFTIHSSTNSIDTAMDEGDSLFCDYRYPPAKGEFIFNRQKDGEIDSFIKIRKYIEQSSVKKATIADPYFSIPEAGKLLTRISRTNLEIDIITSLGEKDTDTGAELDICERYRRFLHNNSSVLHGNLSIYNLRRGRNRVFHDRYLIRYFDNGTIDGFLLSNSLNSMGQFYPFIIAPMDHEVCLDVCDYLNSMCDPTVQNKLPKNERITCDVLFDSKSKTTSSTELLYDQLPLYTWLVKWCEADSRVSVPVQDLPEAVQIIMNHWSENNELACQALCALDSVTCPWSTCELADIINKIAGAATSFLEVCISLAKKKEAAKNHITKGLESEEYIVWALLNGKAEPSRQGFSLLLKRSGHIYYSGDSWLHGGYNLLLCLYPDVYVELIEEIKSPLMFDVLASRMMFYPWDNQLFYVITNLGSLYLQLLCAEWLYEKLISDELSVEEVKRILVKLIPDKRVLQSVRLISNITFYIRTSKKMELQKWNVLGDWLYSLVTLDITKCTSETKEVAIYWLHDCSDISNCKLYLRLAESVAEQTIRKMLLEEAINVAMNSLLNRSYIDNDVSELVLLYIQSMETRYGQEAEKRILGKFVDWDIFKTATEPELRNYSYTKWRSANVRAQWQMEILTAYHRRHPEASKTHSWINRWETRLKNELF